MAGRLRALGLGVLGLCPALGASLAPRQQGSPAHSSAGLALWDLLKLLMPRDFALGQ